MVDVVGETYGIPEEEIDDPTASDDAERTEPKKVPPFTHSPCYRFLLLTLLRMIQSYFSLLQINEGSEEISYASAFEMANGPNHAKKLEELAMHAMMTSQGIYANLDLNQRQIIAGIFLLLKFPPYFILTCYCISKICYCTERMAKVSEIFKKEELSEEESKVTYPLVLILILSLDFPRAA